MREIRFRGKGTETGKWVYGDLRTICVDDGEVTINYPYKHETSGLHVVVSVPVIPATVGQYTGLTDKNGVEIYEGDVLGFPNGPKKYFTVSIGDYLDSFTGFSQYGVYSTATDDETVIGLHSNGAEMTVVIGNIFDNPELLGGESSC